MSMGEIIIILIVAVLVLGPEKLPSTAVQIAKILKALKRQVDDAKESIEKEIRVSEIKKEADKYKNEFSEYNQNIRKKLSFEEFDELKKEIVADTNAIKDDINAIEKDLASLGGAEKSDNANANLAQNSANLSEKSFENSGENSNLSANLNENAFKNSNSVNLNGENALKNSAQSTANLTQTKAEKTAQAKGKISSAKATAKNSKVATKNSTSKAKAGANSKATKSTKKSPSKVEPRNV